MADKAHSKAAIDIRGIVKHFGTQCVLDELSLAVRESETLVIIGCSGCGKSVLLKHMIGILKPERGQIFVNGTDLVPLPDRRVLEICSQFGMLFQGAALFDSLNVWGNVAFSLTEHGTMPSKEIDERVRYCLDLVGLSGAEEKSPAELSGGMRKRVGVARAIAHKPKIILYDEPTTGLDPVMADTINDLVIRTRERMAVTSVAVTHDLRSAYKIGDRIAMMANGKITAIGTPSEIQQSEDPAIRRFLDTSGAPSFTD